MNRTILLLFIVGLLSGCSRDEIQVANPVLSGFKHSACGGFKSSAVAVSENEGEKIVIHYDSVGCYSFDHKNVSFNCCLPAGLSAELLFENDTLYLNEKETLPGNCRCLCSYDLSAEILNLEKGCYVLCLMKESVSRGTITLTFNEGMCEEISISEFSE